MALNFSIPALEAQTQWNVVFKNWGKNYLPVKILYPGTQSSLTFLSLMDFFSGSY